MKIVKSPKEYALLLKGASETIQNEAKTQSWIFWYVIRYIRCLFIRHLLTSKGFYAGDGVVACW